MASRKCAAGIFGTSSKSLNSSKREIFDTCRRCRKGFDAFVARLEIASCFQEADDVLAVQDYAGGVDFDPAVEFDRRDDEGIDERRKDEQNAVDCEAKHLDPKRTARRDCAP
jgi:hypothetical protein